MGYTMSDETHSEHIQGWATSGGGEGDPAASLGDIQSNVDNYAAGFGTYHTDYSTLPSDAQSRPNGAFFDPLDLEKYLDGGGLVYRDANGDPIPNPIVNIVRTYVEDFDDYIYEVWINATTP